MKTKPNLALCLPCSKEVIDSLGASSGLMTCAAASLGMYGAAGFRPSDEEIAWVSGAVSELEEVVKELLARLAATAASSDNPQPRPRPRES